MKLTIFGATGRLGQELVKQALAMGHEVVAYVRTPSKIDSTPQGLAVVQGEMNEPEKIRRAIVGADAVLSALGPTSNQPIRPLTEGMQHIVNAMNAENVSRLIISTGAGVEAPEDDPQLIGKLITFILGIFAKNVLIDSRGMVNVAKNSHLNWTVVRGPRLTDEPKKGEIKAGYAGKGVGTSLTRADFADFMLAQLQSSAWSQKMPMVSN